MSSSSLLKPARWDIYEEHLGEAAFRWSQWEKALDSPDYSLAELAELEESGAAHLDALVLGGEPVAHRLLIPALADEPEHILAGALALLRAESPPGPSAVLTALAAAEPDALAPFQRALELAPTPCIPPEFASLLKKADAAPELWASVVDVLGTHGRATAALCAPLLSHPEPLVVAAALRTLSRARLPVEPAVLQRALGSDAPVLRDVALTVGLMNGHMGAWAACQSAVDSPAPGNRHPLLLLGLSGDERAVTRLVGLLSHEKLRPDVLWALGFSGRIQAADACVELMRHKPVAALAAEAFSAITGLTIEGGFAAAKEDAADEALTPLEEDLERDLSPKPEDDLPQPMAEQVAAWWKETRPRMDPKQRHLSGQPFTPQGLVEALLNAPLRRRHALALELALRSRGLHQVPTRAPVEQQVLAWKSVRAAPASSFNRPFAEGLRG
ncbi:TIGR02270 family protein [Myxococcus llanfairpwllgwyngyllgogerychwyrndrobwllllantysiliogogogochensis]|uniref:TIGR02270 family protein n=1 Tax=Myxococcus llanfairpwllgwyngyllgogerychwyrndrobwllllantysiliogogogochensis TaxID=2590453 RepID=A0A540WKQ1_9BACT|nr:TIGR02270 family protein [Myxococcus llanfairpwllgwyngyllgogerychwyrndrobwllllantysiliogogogochensis]TQF09598.1 TIGR02270 family protein [Myxococcus llanfairpwllgwyngyllgogerychwyrndrobwllllantysiliogogogochensis]